MTNINPRTRFLQNLVIKSLLALSSHVKQSVDGFKTPRKTFKRLLLLSSPSKVGKANIKLQGRQNELVMASIQESVYSSLYTRRE